jgi:hypothetical protein
MNVDRFHDDLAQIAELSEAVDLRDRVLDGSRRLARRRAIVVTTAAAVAVLAVAGVAFAIAPRGSNPVFPSTSTPAPAPTSPLAPSTAATGAPSSTPSSAGAVSFPPARYRLGSWSTSDRASLPGTLYYVTGGDPVRLNVLGGGKLRTAALQGTLAEHDCARQSIVFSPDGSLVAWVEGDNEQLTGGKLVVAGLAGGTAHVVYNGLVNCAGGSGPKWMPDSKRLVVTVADGSTVKLVDVTTGAVTAGPSAWSGYLAWSANGSYVTYGDQGKIVVARPDGTVVKRVPYDINCCTGGFSVQSLSNDGRYVGVSFENSDPGTVRGAMRIVDLSSGKELNDGRVPPSGGGISYLLAGDLRVVGVALPSSMSVDLVNASGKELGSIPVQAGAQLRLYR